MGDRYLTDLAAVVAGAGLTVVEVDGWRSRGRGSGGYDPGRPDHVMLHHTGSPPSASGEDDAMYCTHGDEDAPLCNLYLDRAGTVWVCAAGATNTNGKGHDWWGGGVSDDAMNVHAIGIEANGGAGHPWPELQQANYLLLAGALCDHYGIPVDHVRSHHEWAPHRKIDPAGVSDWSPDDGTWDMAAFRESVKDAAMPLSDTDLDRIADAVWSKMIDTTGKDAPVEPEPARYWLQRTFLIVRQHLGSFNANNYPPDETTLARIDENTR